MNVDAIIQCSRAGNPKLCLPSVDEILSSVSYDPETGLFTRLSSGHEIRLTNTTGYIQIRIGGRHGKAYVAHRLAWKVMTGNDPQNEIDHRNGIRDDNRWCNLRPATRSQNSMNRTAGRGRDVKGLCFSRGRWIVMGCANGKIVRVGSHKSKEMAAALYDEYAKAHHGEFAKLNLGVL